MVEKLETRAKPGAHLAYGSAIPLPSVNEATGVL